MEKRWDVLGFGVVAVDDLIFVEKYPPPDSKWPVLAEERHGGGLAGTALVAAARMGACTAYAGVLGQDDLSRFSLENLQRRGVDCGQVLIRPGARPVNSTVIVEQPTGQRSILIRMAQLCEPDASSVPPLLISACRVLFVDHTWQDVSIKAAAIAHDQGIPVVADIERVGDPLLPRLLELVDHLIIGLELGKILTDETQPAAMAAALAAPWRTCTVVTAGENGSWYSIRGEAARHCPAYPVQVVDTTGCGDVFHGAYAAWISKGESIDRAVRAASIAAGLKAARRGGQDGIPDRETVDRILDVTLSL
jgi:sulfofructose kinase